MKKSFMSNIKQFVDSNVRQRIDRAANSNNEFFGDDLLLVERHFEDIRRVCVEAEKRISAMLQSTNSFPIGAYTQNVQVSLNNAPNLAVINSTVPQSSRHSPETTSMPKHQISSCINSNINTKSNTIVSPSDIDSSLGNTNYSSIQTCANDDVEIRNDLQRHKKLPIVGFLKFLVKSCYKLKPDSLLSTTLTQCSHLQTQLTKLYLTFEHTIESQCLKPLQHIIEVDAPNVIKLRKLFIKAHNDLESSKTKYTGASNKQLQHLQAGHFTSTSYTISQNSAHQSNISKLDQLKKELDENMTRFEQARDTYATELYAFVCREVELVNLFMKFYQYQVDYHLQVGATIQNSTPSLNDILLSTPRKVAFGTSLEEHLRCTGRSVSLIIELSIHLLYSNGLNEEGLFRIPGSSVKIKKLKNAINAWFVTLASQSELEADSSQWKDQSCISAIYDLFKDVAGQRPQSLICSGGVNQSVTMKDDSTSLSQDGQQLVFDVHTIAGLLKLYLRELPEPLFTYALYNQWIEAAVSDMKNNQPEALEKIIRQLPKANYDNLRHLVKFLHILTRHRDLNKMTSTNLAITMAPSLIWAPNNSGESPAAAATEPLDAEQLQESCNVQMTNVGMSASLHAFVIENLINNAEKLLPGSVEFMMSGLNDVSPASCDKVQQFRKKHQEKSSSPTGLSTASSSSFSSASSASAGKSHSRKGGSMEGLLPGAIPTERTRPVSVMLDQSQHQGPRQPPPAPAIRSLLKLNSETLRQVPQRPPAPARPSARRQRDFNQSDLHRPTLASQTPASSEKSVDLACPKPVSLRGTGTSSNVASAITRPTVPPPNRPQKLSTEDYVDQIDGQQSCDSKYKDGEGLQSDSKSSHSVASSGNLRAEFEEINVVDVEDIDISVLQVSPIVSLDSISGGEDSSFDNDCRSLEHSWTECVLSHNRLTTNNNTNSASDHNSARSIEVIGPAEGERRDIQSKISEGLNEVDEAHAGESLSPPPAKPPRNISPKITQSTPL